MSGYMQTLYGALIAMCVLAGVFFLRYWGMTRDRFFIWFACAFWTFALNWALLSIFELSEYAGLVFAVRLVGFLQIVVAIVIKNRSPR